MISTNATAGDLQVEDESFYDPVELPPPPLEMGEKLFEAIYSYSEPEAKRILTMPVEIDVNYKSANNSMATPLMFACSRGYVDVVKGILEKGGDVHHTDKNGATVLSKACSSGKIEIVRLIINGGANVPTDKFSLAAAIESGMTDIVTLLLEHGVSLEQPNQYVQSPMMAAAQRGNVKVLQMLVDRGAPVDELTEYYWTWRTPLMAAASAANVEAVQFLVAQGASVTAKNKVGETVLMYAAEGNNLTIVTLLLEKGASATEFAHTSGETALMWSAKGLGIYLYGTTNDAPGVLAMLLEAGCPLDVKAKNGRTALLYAISAGAAKSAEFLLGQGADIHVTTENGETAVILAALSARKEVMDLVLAHGADPHALAQNGDSALIAAAHGGNAKIVQQLVDLGLDVNHVNKSNETPAFWAVRYRRMDALKLLVSLGADINIASKDYSPLHWAAYYGNVEMAAYLMEQGADTNFRDAAGRVVLDVTKTQQVRDVIINAQMLRAKEESSRHIATSRQKVVGIGQSAPLPPEKEAELGAQLNVAVVAGDLERVRALVGTPGVNLDFRFQGSDTALVAACYEGQEAVAQVLVDAGANLDMKDGDGWTPLHWAAYHGHAGLVRMLLQAGADATITSKKGSTAEKTAKLPEIKAIFAEPRGPPAPRGRKAAGGPVESYAPPAPPTSAMISSEREAALGKSGADGTGLLSVKPSKH